MSRRRPLGAAAACALAVWAAPALADGSGDDAVGRTAWLDADAPVIAAVRPAGVDAIATALAGEPALADGVAAARAAVGADLLRRDGWSAAGLDPDRAVVLSLAAIDDARAAPIFDRLFELDEWTDAALRKLPKTYWRSRAVIAVRDPKRAARTVRSLARATDGLYMIGKRDAAEISMMLGGRTRRAERVARRLRKRKLVAIGWWAGVDAVVAVRVLPRRKLLLVDVVGSFAGVPAVWTRDSTRLLAAIERNPGTSRLPAALRRGAGARTFDAELAIWVRPGPLLALARAAARHTALRALAADRPDRRRRRELHGEAKRSVDACEQLRPLATRGPLTDLALALEVNARGVRARLQWGVRKGAGLRRALAVRDDALMAWPGPRDAIAVAAWYLRGLDRLRALPRPAVMRGGFDGLGDTVSACGAGASFVVALFGWPTLLGTAVDEYREQDAAHEPVVDGAGNGVLAVRALGDDPQGAIAVALGAGHTAALATLLDRRAGKANRRRIGRRTITLWPQTSPQPFSFPLAARRAAAGAAWGTRAATWFARAAGASPKPPIARWRVDPAVLLGQTEPPLPAWLRALGPHLGPLGGTLSLTGRILTLEGTGTLF